MRRRAQIAGLIVVATAIPSRQPRDSSPQFVDSRRPECAKAVIGDGGASGSNRRRRHSRKLPVSATAACSMTPTTMADTVSACLGNISVSLGSAVPKSWNWRKSRPFRHRVRARSGSRCSPPGLASPIPSSVGADIRTSKGHCRWLCCWRTSRMIEGERSGNCFKGRQFTAEAILWADGI
jgi:hypothetical protein